MARVSRALASSATSQTIWSSFITPSLYECQVRLSLRLPPIKLCYSDDKANKSGVDTKVE
jgi:hypothetical protein